MTRHMPPFGDQVARILSSPSMLRRFSGSSADGKTGTVWIATGPDAHDWKKARPRHLIIVLPVGADPLSYDWSFLQGHEPPLVLPPIADQPEQMARLAAAMLRDGIGSVLAFCSDKPLRYVLDIAA